MNAPSFFDQAHTRIAEFIFQANKVNNLSWDITNKSGRRAELLLSHRKLGIALLSPHGREGWGLVDFSWSLLEEHPKEYKDNLLLDPARLDVVRCHCGPTVNMPIST